MDDEQLVSCHWAIVGHTTAAGPEDNSRTERNSQQVSLQLLSRQCWALPGLDWHPAAALLRLCLQFPPKLSSLQSPARQAEALLA